LRIITKARRVTISHAIKAGGPLGPGYRLWSRVDVSIGVGADEGRRSAFQSPRAGSHARHHVEAALEGPPQPGVCWPRNAYISMIETAQNVARPLLTEPRGDRRLRSAISATCQGWLVIEVRLAKEIMPVTIPGDEKDTCPAGRNTMSSSRDDTNRRDWLAALYRPQPGTTQITAAPTPRP